MSLLVTTARGRLGAIRVVAPGVPGPGEPEDTGGLNSASALAAGLQWYVVSGDHSRRDRVSAYDGQAEGTATIASDAGGSTAVHVPSWLGGGWYWPSTGINLGSTYTIALRLSIASPTEEDLEDKETDFPKLLSIPYHVEPTWDMPFGLHLTLLPLTAGAGSAQARLLSPVNASARNRVTSPDGFVLLDGAEHTYGVRVQSNGSVNWWRDGVQVGTTSWDDFAHAAPDLGAAPHLIALAEHRLRLTEGTRATMPAAAIWGVALPDSQMATFHDNPRDLVEISTGPPVSPALYAWDSYITVPAGETTEVFPTANDSGAGLEVIAITQPAGVAPGTVVTLDEAEPEPPPPPDPDDPLSLPNLLLALDPARSPVTINGGVSQINDLGSAGRHFIQTDADRRPALEPGGIQGGPALRGQGSSFLRREEPLLGLRPDFALYVLVRGPAQGNRRIYSEGNTSSDLSHWYLDSDATGRLRLRMYNNSGTRFVDAITNATVFNDQPRIICVSRSGSSGQIWVNRTLDTTFMATQTMTLNRTGLLVRLRTTADQMFDGRLGPVYAYSTPRTAEQAIAVEDYLESYGPGTGPGPGPGPGPGEPGIITGITWAPASSIIYAAPESDNWPITWADDGDQYTSYGDGWGFAPPFQGQKLSMGFSKIAGNPPGFVGTNIPSPTGEKTGDGASGEKGSGMLMVEGVLYAWARNADNNGRQSRLLWSADRAATWTWATWQFAELGFANFLNFGQNYAGARDDYVYTYSPNTNSAYNETDHVVLARVPKASIAVRANYEFFAGFDGSGDPTWSSNIGARQSVFHLQGGCNRMSVTYNAPLGLYMMTMRSRARTSGGRNAFSIWQALEPWGPWSQVYYTEQWEGGSLSTTNGGWGESSHIPAKWIAADGKSFYLVFAGNDSFAVRQATLTVEEAPPAAPPAEAPVMLDPSATQSTATWPWQATSGATAYTVEHGPEGGAHATVTLGNVLTYTAVGLSAASTYEARVRGRNAAGDGPFSDFTPVTTLAESVAGEQPLGVFTHGDVINVTPFEDLVEMPVTLWMTSMPWGDWDGPRGPSWKLNPMQSTLAANPGVRIILMYPMVSNVEGFGSTSLTKGANGDYNQHYATFASRLKSRGIDNLILRAGWEASGGWYPWGFNNNTTNADRFRQMWIHFVNTVNNEYPENRFVFQMDLHQDVTNSSLNAVYPGAAFVDVLSMSSYDEWWGTPPVQTHFPTRWETTVAKLNRLRNFAASQSKPIAFAEWGVWSAGNDQRGGGDNPYYIEQKWKYMLDPANNCHFNVYFNVNATGDHRLQVHPNALAAFKLFGSSTSSPLHGVLAGL